MNKIKTHPTFESECCLQTSILSFSDKKGQLFLFDTYWILRYNHWGPETICWILPDPSKQIFSAKLSKFLSGGGGRQNIFGRLKIFGYIIYFLRFRLLSYIFHAFQFISLIFCPTCLKFAQLQFLWGRGQLSVRLCTCEYQ